MKQSIFYLQRKQKFRVLCMVEKFNFINHKQFAKFVMFNEGVLDVLTYPILNVYLIYQKSTSFITHEFENTIMILWYLYISCIYTWYLYI